MQARRDLCRSAASRYPVVRTWRRSVRLSQISSVDMARTRAAANSMASGTPSRSRHRRTTAGALSGVSSKSEDAEVARSTNRLTAS